MSLAADHMGFDAHSSLPSRREVIGWLTAGLVVVAMHALAAGVFQSLQALDEQAAELEAPMVVELTPVPFVAPSEVESETISENVAPQESTAYAGSETLSEDNESTTTKQDIAETAEEVPLDQAKPVTAEPLKETSPEPVTETVTETSTEPVVEPITEPELTEPETVEAVTPEVAVPLPTPRPEEEVEEEPKPQPKKVAEKPKTEPVKKAPKAKPAEKVADKPAERQATLEAAPAARSQASTALKASLEEKWKARVSAWIARHKPRSVGGRGLVYVNFYIDSSGVISNARVIKSSGDDHVDEGAVGMVVRSSPVPAPPPEIAGNRHSVSLPVEFKR